MPWQNSSTINYLLSNVKLRCYSLYTTLCYFAQFSFRPPLSLSLDLNRYSDMLLYPETWFEWSEIVVSLCVLGDLILTRSWTPDCRGSSGRFKEGCQHWPGAICWGETHQAISHPQCVKIRCEQPILLARGSWFIKRGWAANCWWEDRQLQILSHATGVWILVIIS